MRYIVSIALLCSFLVANQLNFETNYLNALKKAKQQNKKVMMIYSAKWCPECEYMKDVVFKEDKVFDYIQKYFIVLSLDIDKDKLPEGFNYVGIPTFFFIDKNAKEIDRIVGGDKADKFLNSLKEIK
jgi:thioredoxin-related protein